MLVFWSINYRLIQYPCSWKSNIVNLQYAWHLSLYFKVIYHISGCFTDSEDVHATTLSCRLFTAHRHHQSRWIFPKTFRSKKKSCFHLLCSSFRGSSNDKTQYIISNWHTMYTLDLFYIQHSCIFVQAATTKKLFYCGSFFDIYIKKVLNEVWFLKKKTQLTLRTY